MKVYVVTSGCYSDYGIVGMFSSREQAEAFMRAFPAEGYSSEYNELEEYELDQPLPEPAQRGLAYYEVQMRRNGDVVRISGQSKPDEPIEGLKWGWSEKEWVSGGGYQPVPKEQQIGRFMVWARDKEHAVKVANERRIQALASPDS